MHLLIARKKCCNYRDRKIWKSKFVLTISHSFMRMMLVWELYIYDSQYFIYTFIRFLYLDLKSNWSNWCLIWFFVFFFSPFFRNMSICTVIEQDSHYRRTFYIFMRVVAHSDTLAPVYLSKTRYRLRQANRPLLCTWVLVIESVEKRKKIQLMEWPRRSSIIVHRDWRFAFQLSEP